MKTIVLGPPGTGKTHTLLNQVEDYLKNTDPPIFYEGDVLLRKTIPPKGTNTYNPHVIINITKVA